MRTLFLPYVLNREDAERLRRALLRDARGARTLRDLNRRHRLWPQIIETAAAAGIIRIEKRQPHTGRPALFAVLELDAVNKIVAAKLPFRSERALSLTFREEDFLKLYACRGNTSAHRSFGFACAADAYRAVYGCHRALTPGSVRSAGARLARQPWMKAAFFLQRRTMQYGLLRRWPDDLRSAAQQWLQLVRALNEPGDWPEAACRVILAARTYPDAIAGLRELDQFASR